MSFTMNSEPERPGEPDKFQPMANGSLIPAYLCDLDMRILYCRRPHNLRVEPTF